MISADDLLQKHQYIYGLKHDVIIAPCSVIPIILDEFYNSKSHQGTIHTFEAIRNFYWWPKLHQDIVNYINKCEICAKNKSTQYGQIPTKHLEIPQVPVAGLAMDTKGHLLVTFTLLGFNSNMYSHSICVCYINERKVSRKFCTCLAYLLIGTPILSDNGTE